MASSSRSRTASSAFFSAAGRSLSPYTSPVAKVSPFEDPPLFSSTNVSRERWRNEQCLEENDSEVERLRICDVFVGFYGRREPSLKRFVKWLRAEMAMHGVLCFVSNWTRCLDARAHAMARTAMEEATLGLVILTRLSFSNPWSIEELKILLGRKNLIPVFFGLSQSDCFHGGFSEEEGGEWREALEGLSRLDLKLEVNMNNMRDCILETISLIGAKLGRRDVVERVRRWKESIAKDELPFKRNPGFMGREKELAEMKLILFGEGEGDNSRRESDKKKNKGKAKEAGIGKGIAYVSGESGIGKSELLLEFSYRNLQSYKLVLWVRGEARYLRANYLNLLPILGVDVSIDNELCLERKGIRSFEETEHEAIQKVRKELMRGIPYLLVIENLQSEKDQWDGRNIMELLPCLGGDTHIIISSRLPKLINVRPLRLSYLPNADAITLVKGRLSDLKDVEHDAIEVIEERLDRLPFGLAIAGALLSEESLDPPKLLEAINRMPYIEMQSSEDDSVIRRNSFLSQLLDVCFSVFDQRKKHGRMAMIMMQIGSWFAPAPIPIPMISFAAHEAYKERYSSSSWIKCCQMFTYGPQPQKANPLMIEAANMLVRFHLARYCTSEGSISFHEITRIYARKRGERFASTMVRAVSIFGCLPMDSNHIWAASYLLFKLRDSSISVNLAVPELLSFINKFVIPLANSSFKSLSQCAPVLVLLRISTEALESLENVGLAETVSKEVSSFCFTGTNGNPTLHAHPQLYLDVVNLRATLLELRAKFFLQCGQYDIGEQLCRTSLNIKEVIYGWEHPETLSTREIMETLLKLQSNL
ncbi:hypothetical protein AXF42_Ash011881 [Apostasia shenzhenica]|uniref:Plant disease resistance WDH domain-containing protein n=1 Tax=Apostasia shenzhenica TaxID=1088818 RepID=A0A2I0AW31_9ASPA|nr:hypothetical protein AXF42_Ash011881 [Apostasia shenzhenica]